MELSIQLTLSFNTSYAVSVRAMGHDGKSTVSSEVVFTTEPSSRPTLFLDRSLSTSWHFLSVQMWKMRSWSLHMKVESSAQA